MHELLPSDGSGCDRDHILPGKASVSCRNGPGRGEHVCHRWRHPGHTHPGLCGLFLAVARCSHQGLLLFLPKNVHVVCVDMPGHEGTSRTGAADYAIEGQVKRIRQFVESIHLDKKPFHLVGTSMGGNVAGVYAARYPRDLCSVTLVCPAGLNNPTHSKFVKLLQGLEKSKDSHSIPLIPSTPEEMEEMLKLCSFVRFKIPQQILRGLVDVRIPHNDFYREVFLEIVGENSRHSLHDNMHLISAPLQVIWGKQDQVLDVSGASLVAAAVPGCQVDLLDNCGHSVVMERPRKTAQLMMDFITAQQNAGSASNKKLS
ncbi:monoacylglycerol lipase abhd6-A isoform X2 [Denticeps clupeoides]|uniref:monoacylglycerol lipase abhd6-A isoform X2 n=1 Tax=Denticeps clupeoides TaxID=299321 RepID=UPI0010A368CE|nr:monoacylglycerol lipase ABHD6 isoform X2 [Denticeps clupeoides]